MLRWFSRLLRRRRLETELDEELRFHLEMQAEANRAAGMSADEALRAARRQFGHVDSVKESCRDQRHLGRIEDTWRDLRQAARSLRRDPGFAGSVTGLLALSVATVAIVRMYYAGFLLSDPPYLRKPDEVVAIFAHPADKPEAERLVSMPDFRDWSASSRTFERISAYLHLGGAVSTGDRHDWASGLGVSAGFFDVLGVQASLGRTFSAEEFQAERTDAIVISHRFWQERFGGSPDVLGKQVVFFTTPATIIGVMPPEFDFPHGQSYWWPMNRRMLPPDDRDQRRLALIGRIKAGSSRKDATAEMAAQVQATDANLPAELRRSARVIPLRDRFNTSFQKQSRLFLGAALVVQVLAALNIAGLLFARSLVIMPQIALRAALGASRARLLRESLAEPLLLSLAGLALGLAFASAVRPAIIAALAPEWPFPSWWRFELSLPVLAFAAASSVGTVMLFALIPAWRTSRVTLDPQVRSVNSSRGASPRARRIRSSAVAVQIAAALVLVLGAALTLADLRVLRSTPLGIDPEGIFTLTVTHLDRDQEANSTYFTRLLDETAILPGVTAAGLGLTMPGSFDRNHRNVTAESTDLRQATFEGILLRSITPAILDVFRIPLLQGRNFNAGDTAASEPVVMIDRTFAERAFPGANPIGKRISMELAGKPPRWMTIIGVVGPTRSNPFAELAPTIYESLIAQTRSPVAVLYLRVHGEPAPVLESARAVARRLESRVSLITQLDGRYAALVAGTYWQARFFSRVMAGFALLAFVIATAGIGAIVAFNVARQRHDVGVKLALGATPSRVTAEITAWGLKLGLAGVALGLCVALTASPWFKGQLSKVSASDPAIYAGVGGLFLVVTVAACWWPARRAARVDPMITLRAE